MDGEMILVSGSLAYDYIMDFPGYFRDHILPDKLHVLSVSFLIDKMERNFGGTAGNIAYNLALLGERPKILASAGNDFEEYERWLTHCGMKSNRKAKSHTRRGAVVGRPSSRLDFNRIDPSCIQWVREAPTASAFMITDKADNQITAFYPGAMAYRVTCNVKRVTQGARLAIVAPGNLEDMKRLPALYKKYGVSYMYDPGQNIVALSGAQLRAGIDGAKVFISNDYELAMVLKKTGWKKHDILNRVEVLVTTLGEKGSIIEISNFKFPISNKIPNSKFQIHKFIIPPAKPKNTSDPTGAGDAYRAGFIKGLFLGLPYDKVGKLASTVAVYTVEKYGTQTHRFTWGEVVRRYRANYGEGLV